jgi:hypothetical protein
MIFLNYFLMEKDDVACSLKEKYDMAYLHVERIENGDLKCVIEIYVYRIRHVEILSKNKLTC